jgi:hypothetical protein
METKTDKIRFWASVVPTLLVIGLILYLVFDMKGRITDKSTYEFNYAFTTDNGHYINSSSSFELYDESVKTADHILRIPWTDTLSDAQKDLIKDSIGMRKEQYHNTLTEIQWSMNAMLVMCLISIYFLVGKTSRIKLPFVDKEASIKWLIWAAPPIFCYLWLQFGFAFYNGIQTRRILIDLTHFIDLDQFPKVYSNNYTYEDNSILDFIFQVHHPFYKTQGSVKSYWINFFTFYSGYTLFFGVFHGLFLVYIRRWLKNYGQKHSGAFIGFGAAFLIILLASHIAFHSLLPLFWLFQIAFLVVALLVFLFQRWKNLFHDILHPNE